MEDPETVYQAILTLYGSQDAVASGNASVWLGEFQKSLFAWEVSDKLLHERKDQVSCYFAAQTMRTKIQCSFHELPAESYDSLRESLQEHLSNFCTNAEENSVILTQLCLALADLYLQVASWTSFVGDILARFGSGPPEQNLMLLNLLKVFPEETEGRSLRLGANRRKEIFEELAARTPAVIEFLMRMLEMNKENASVVCRIFDCLGSWLLNTSIPTDFLAESPVLKFLLNLLADPKCPSHMHDRGTDCLVQALYLCEDVGKHKKLAQQLFCGIHEMAQSFHICVAEEDFDKLHNYCRLFTELTESLLQTIVDSPDSGLGSLSSLELLLTAIGFHDYALAEMSFNVWYRLSEFLYLRDSDDVNSVFKPYVERLIMALYKHSRFDSDYQGIPESNKEFSEFREKVTEVIKDVVFIVGSRQCFEHMLELLKQQGQTSSWDETEAALFIMAVVAKNIIPDEEAVVPCVVQAILGLPEKTHVAIRYTAVRLLGQLCEWIENNAECLEKVLDWILECLQIKGLAKVSAESLELICSTCHRKLLPHFDRLSLSVLALDANSVPEDAVVALLRGISTTMVDLPCEEITPKLNYLCSKQAEQLAEILQSNNNYVDSCLEEDREKRKKNKDPVIWLDRLAAVFRQLTPNETDNGKIRPWLPVVEQLWPLLSETCNKYQTNVRTVEHCCRTIRFTIRCLGVQSFPFIEPLVTQMVDIYQRHPHSCFLYLGSILVDEYGQYEQIGPGLLQMLQAFTGPTFKLLEQPNGFVNHPDTVDDLFRLCIRFVQKAPFAFFPCESSVPLFQCGMAALSLDHRDANQSVTKYFVECIEFIGVVKKNNVKNPGTQAAEDLLKEFGGSLVENAIVAAIFHLSSYFIRDIAEILFALGKLDAVVLSNWLKPCLESIPHKGGLAATPEQLSEFYSRVTSARDLKSVSQALRDLTRLYR